MTIIGGAVERGLTGEGLKIGPAQLDFYRPGGEFLLLKLFGNIVGLLIQSRLPEFVSLEQYDPRCSEDQFGIVASCDEKDQEGLMDCFRKEGGEVTVFDRLNPDSAEQKLDNLV